MPCSIIGVGSFGFVVSSPINYFTHIGDDEFVGKILSPNTDDDDIENEWALSNMLKMIDPNNLHFIYPIDKVHITKTNISVNVQDKLPWYFNIIDQSIYTQFIMKNGGMSLRNVIKQRSIPLQDMIKFTLDASYGIRKLLENRLIHCDLHLQNLVVKDGVCKMIDFNISTDFNSFYHEAMLEWCSEYAISPSDTRVYHKMYDIEHEKSMLAQYIQVTPDLLDFIFDNDVFMTSYTKLVHTMAHQPSDQNIIIMKACKSHTKVDIYGLGVCLLEMYLNIKRVTTLEYNVCIIIEKIITMMLLAHPVDRISIHDLIKELEITLFLIGD
jgi:serine/threonine protein kinase